MSKIGWTILKEQVKSLFQKQEEKTYLEKLLDSIETRDSEGNNLPFRIVDIKERGFTVKVCGLFGYISFAHMPWTYKNNLAWNAVFQYIKGNLFFGEIYKTQRDPVSIILNGEIPQFKEPALREDNLYYGVVINKIDYGVFVDIGYSFNWKSGSVIGLLHISNFESNDNFEKIEIGEIIKIIFWGTNDTEQLIFGLKADSKEWYNSEIEQLTDTITPVKVTKTLDNNPSYEVMDRYSATLLIDKTLYPGNKSVIKKAIRNLDNNEIIHCRILSINKTKRTFQLFWNNQKEIEQFYSRNKSKINRRLTLKNTNPETINTIENCLNSELKEHLALIGKTVYAKVIKEEKESSAAKVKYLVEDKFFAKLTISNTFFTFGFKELRHIEENLNDGEIISCKVLSIKNNTMNVEWQFRNEELFRFFK